MDIETVFKSTEGIKQELARLATHVENICKEVETGKSETGYNRCASRLQRIIRLEHESIACQRFMEEFKELIPIIKELQKRREAFDIWLMRFAMGMVILAMLRLAFPNLPLP